LVMMMGDRPTAPPPVATAAILQAQGNLLPSRVTIFAEPCDFYYTTLAGCHPDVQVGFRIIGCT
jgi:hypothetical protein